MVVLSIPTDQLFFWHTVKNFSTRQVHNMQKDQSPRMASARSVRPEPLAGNYTNWHFSPGHWADNVLFLSGCTGADADGHVSADISQQCHAAFAKLELTLDAANLSFRHVVDMTTYHVGLQEGLAIFKSIKDNYIVEPYPAWTAIGVVELASPGALIEIRAVAIDNDV